MLEKLQEIQESYTHPPKRPQQPNKPKSQIWFHKKSQPKDFFRNTLVYTLHFIHNYPAIFLAQFF